MTSNAEYPLRWFFCSSQAKILPFPTAFGNLVWEYTERPLVGIGQVDRAITWDKGRNRGFAGQNWQGEPEWFVNGIPEATLAGPLPRLICGTFNLWARGGLAHDGAATTTNSDGLFAFGGVKIGGSAFGMFALTAHGGTIFNSGARFDGPINLMPMGGILWDKTSYLEAQLEPEE